MTKNRIKFDNQRHGKVRMTLLLAGFTMVEMLTTVAVIGAVAAIGFVAYTGTADSAERSKLTQDVAALNAALRTYEAFGVVFGGHQQFAGGNRQAEDGDCGRQLA
ncbi:MAG: type II secretion system protein [Verrucomicrobiales bacterium]